VDLGDQESEKDSGLRVTLLRDWAGARPTLRRCISQRIVPVADVIVAAGVPPAATIGASAGQGVVFDHRSVEAFSKPSVKISGVPADPVRVAVPLPETRFATNAKRPVTAAG
jgi:hypothetical protein